MGQVSNLCCECRTALEISFHEKRKEYATVTWSNLNDTANAGCQICLWIRHCLQQSYDELNEEDWDYEYDFEVRKAFEMSTAHYEKPDPQVLKGIPLEANAYFADEYEDRDRFFRFILLPVHPEETWPDSYEPPSSSGDENTLKLITYWTDFCQEHHSICHRNTQSAWAPNRLIHIQRQGDKAISASLHEAAQNDYPPLVNYVTLSHRWLPHEPLLLLSENRSRLRKEVPLDKLKPGVQDAMFVCLELGVEYIWIDTICIVQDDPSDLNRELRDMHRIYGSAKCTIAAGVTGGGCFTSRGADMLRNNIITLTIAGEALEYRIKADWSEGIADLRKCTLGGRAWIFQERFLSPRIIHFCDRLIHWECRELEASEIFPRGKPGWRRSYTNRPMCSDDQTQGSLTTKRLELPAWGSVVSDYTSRSLTFRTDRLRALAGVAAYYAEVTADEYIFGLWRRTLPVSLLWGVAGSNEEPVKQRLADVAPSWSWASISGQVSSSGWTDLPHELLAAVIEPKDVESKQSLYQNQRVVTVTGTSFKGTVQGDLAGSFVDDHWYATSPAIAGHLTLRVLLDINDTETFRPFEAYFLPIIFVEQVGTDGIILEALGNIVPSTYRRIGVFNVDSRIDFDAANAREEYRIC